MSGLSGQKEQTPVGKDETPATNPTQGNGVSITSNVTPIIPPRRPQKRPKTFTGLASVHSGHQFHRAATETTFNANYASSNSTKLEEMMKLLDKTEQDTKELKEQLEEEDYAKENGDVDDHNNNIPEQRENEEASEKNDNLSEESKNGLVQVVSGSQKNGDVSEQLFEKDDKEGEEIVSGKESVNNDITPEDTISCTDDVKEDLYDNIARSNKHTILTSSSFLTTTNDAEAPGTTENTPSDISANIPEITENVPADTNTENLEVSESKPTNIDTQVTEMPESASAGISTENFEIPDNKHANIDAKVSELTESASTERNIEKFGTPKDEHADIDAKITEITENTPTDKNMKNLEASECKHVDTNTKLSKVSEDTSNNLNDSPTPIAKQKPRVPKKLSSKIAAFQKMLQERHEEEQNPLTRFERKKPIEIPKDNEEQEKVGNNNSTDTEPVEDSTQKSEETVQDISIEKGATSNVKPKFQGSRANFVNNLNGLFAMGMPMPGISMPNKPNANKADTLAPQVPDSRPKTLSKPITKEKKLMTYAKKEPEVLVGGGYPLKLLMWKKLRLKQMKMLWKFLILGAFHLLITMFQVL